MGTNKAFSANAIAISKQRSADRIADMAAACAKECTNDFTNFAHKFADFGTLFGNHRRMVICPGKRPKTPWFARKRIVSQSIFSAIQVR